MIVKDYEIKFLEETVIIHTVSFGKSIFIYVGSFERNFNDLVVSMPNLTTTHLIGDSPSDELCTASSEITKEPTIFSYSFPLENETDHERFDFVKISLRKILKERYTKVL